MVDETGKPKDLIGEAPGSGSVGVTGSHQETIDNLWLVRISQWQQALYNLQQSNTVLIKQLSDQIDLIQERQHNSLQLLKDLTAILKENNAQRDQRIADKLNALSQKVEDAQGPLETAVVTAADPLPEDQVK